MNLSFAFKLFASLMALIYLLLNYYVGLRCLQGLKSYLPALHPVVYWLIFAVISLGYLSDRIFHLKLSWLKIAGSYWIAAFMYLLLFFILLDLLGLLNGKLSFFPAWQPVWQSKKIYAGALVVTALILIAGSIVAHSPRLVTYDLTVKKAAAVPNLKLVLISDLHVDSAASTGYLEKAAERITALQPDLIVLAGDVAEDTDPKSQENLSRILAKLQARHGIYAVPGNHDYYGGDGGALSEFLATQGIRVLRDEAVTLTDLGITVAGRNDIESGRILNAERRPLSEILNGVDPGKPLILIDHQPQKIEEAKQAGVDLMLSGHTHGGQLFPLQLFTKSLFVIDRGLWQDGSFHLIVSTGLGVWGPPIKTSSFSEIVEINLKVSD